MGEYTLSIQQSSNYTNAEFIGTILPPTDSVNIVVEESFTISVSAGLAWAGNAGWRILRVNSITLKSSNTTYALYNTPFEVSGSGGTGEMKDVQLIVTDTTTFVNDILAGKSISCVMNYTNVDGHDSYASQIKVVEQTITFTTDQPKFPLNVEIGSPQYTTKYQLNYRAGSVDTVYVIPTTAGTTPVNNSYYTIQSQDGLYWMTGFSLNWRDDGGTWVGDIRWSSSNTDSLPAQSICWCIWTKEYYQSIIDRLSS